MKPGEEKKSHTSKIKDVIDVEAVSQRVRMFATKHNLTGSFIAQRLGMNNPHYYVALSGKRVTFTIPQFIALRDLMNEYGENVTLDYLIEGKEFSVRSSPAIKEGSDLASDLKRQIEKLAEEKSKLETEVRSERERSNKCFDQNQKLIEALTNTSVRA